MEDSNLFKKSVKEGADLISKSKSRLINSFEAQLFDIIIQGYTFFGYDSLVKLLSQIQGFIDYAQFRDEAPKTAKEVAACFKDFENRSEMPDDIREASEQFEKDNPDLPF